MCIACVARACPLDLNCQTLFICKKQNADTSFGGLLGKYCPLTIAASKQQFKSSKRLMKSVNNIADIKS